MRKFCFYLLMTIALTVTAQDNIEVVNIENRAVRDYMADSWKTYNENPSYRTSVIVKYNNTDKYGRKLYWPAGKEVHWTPTAPESEIKEILVSVSQNQDLSYPFIFHPESKDASSYIIRNLFPNCIYYYKVEEILYNGTVTLMAEGKFRTVGQVRMVYAPGVSNMRDLGGWPTQYGVPVRYGRLYRSANLDRITQEGIHYLVDNLNIRAELDLREETKRTTSPLGADKEYMRLPLPLKMTLSSAVKNNNVYVRYLRWMIKQLNEGKNVDWHCAIGCDRCGMVSYLVEGLLGLSEIDLCRDYELSTFLFGRNNKRERGGLSSRISYIKKFGPDDNLALCFYNLWLSLGMQPQELNYFLAMMLGNPDIEGVIGEPAMVNR